MQGLRVLFLKLVNTCWEMKKSLISFSTFFFNYWSERGKKVTGVKKSLLCLAFLLTDPYCLLLTDKRKWCWFFFQTKEQQIYSCFSSSAYLSFMTRMKLITKIYAMLKCCQIFVIFIFLTDSTVHSDLILH